MKLSQIKEIIKHELRGIRAMRENRMMLMEKKVCDCCGAYAAAKAAKDCMDSGGTQSGTGSDGCYTIHCEGGSAMVLTPDNPGGGTGGGKGRGDDAEWIAGFTGR